MYGNSSHVGSNVFSILSMGEKPNTFSLLPVKIFSNKSYCYEVTFHSDIKKMCGSVIGLIKA